MPPDPRARFGSYAPTTAIGWDDATRTATLDGTLASFDLSGFTRLSERLAKLGRDGAEEITVAVNSVFGNLIEIALDTCGDAEATHDIISFGGDAILVLFRGGAHATRAARAAAAMQRYLRANGSVGPDGYRARLRMSVGLHSGLFTMIRIGDEQWFLTVVGANATRTVDLESASEPGEILVSAQTAALLPSDWVGTRDDGELTLHRAAIAKPNLTGLRPPGPADERWLPPQVRGVVADADERWGEHRRAAVGFVKASGVDELLASAGPERCTEALMALSRTVEAACVELDVCWLAYDIAPGGVKLILTAGAPVATETDEERMLRTLHAIASNAHALEAFGLELHIGATAGNVFAADLGHPVRRAYTAMGDCVNTAARLMQRSAAGEALVTPQLVEGSATRFELDWLEPFAVKGKSILLRAARLGAALERSSATEHAASFVARDREYGVLQAAWTRAVGGENAVVEVRGEAGLGKSRLTLELLEAVRAGDAQHVLGQADPLASGSAYGAMRAPLRALFGVEVDAEPTLAGEQLARCVVTHAPQLAPWLPLLALTIGADVPDTPEAAALDEAFKRAQIESAVVELLASCVDRPTLLVVEDTHWADESSLALLGALARLRASHGVCIVTTSRPNGSPLPCDDELRTVVELDPLPDAATLQLVLAEVGDTPIDDHTIRMLSDRAGGSPLFVRGLVEAWRSGQQDLPGTVERLAAARMDQLSIADRALLRRAAVIGRTIDLGVLAEVVQDDGVAAPSRWASVAAFVESAGSGTVRFRHDLERDVAYSGLAARERRRLHFRVADAVARTGSVDDATVVATLAGHYFHAGAWEPARAFSVRAAAAARAAAAPLAAAEHLERAVRCEAALRVAAPDRARSLEALGDAYQLAGRIETACTALARAQRFARDDVELSGRIAVTRARCEARRGRFPTSLRVSTMARRRLEARHGPDSVAVVAALWGRTSLVHHLQGRHDKAVAEARLAVAAAASVGDPRVLADAYLGLELAASTAGTPDAGEIGARAAELCREVGDHAALGNVLNNLGVNAMLGGDWPRAHLLYEEASQSFARVGDIPGAAIVDNNRCEILIDQARYGEAGDEIDRLRRIFGVAGDSFMLTCLICARGLLETRRGELADAASDLTRAEEEFAAGNLNSYWMETRARHIELMLTSGAAADAMAAVDELIAATTREPNPDMAQSRLLRLRGLAAARLDRTDEARRALIDAVDAARAASDSAELAFSLHALDAVVGLDAAARAEWAELTRRLGILSYPGYGFAEGRRPVSSAARSASH